MNILYDMMIRSKKCEKNRRKKLFRFYIYKIIYPIIYLSLLIRTDLQLRRLWLRKGRRWWGCPGESQNFKRVQPSAYNTPSELLTPKSQTNLQPFSVLRFLVKIYSGMLRFLREGLRGCLVRLASREEGSPGLKRR